MNIALPEIEKIWAATGAKDVVFDEHGTELSELHEVVAYMRRQIDEAQTEIKKQRHRATNAEYMAEAYRNMLGPNGLAVAKMWDEKGTTRVHYSWGPKAFTDMDGEARAAFILAMPAGTPMDPKDL